MAYETTDQLLAEISDYWEKAPDSNMHKLIDAFNAPFEAIDTSAKQVEHWRAISDAKGTTLDLFGKDVKAYRPSTDDDTFRFLIHIIYLLSHAQGTIPSIYKIASSTLDNENYFKIYKTGVRHIGIQILFDSIKSLEMQKLLMNDLQKMLALGYWVDSIIFCVSTALPLYIGANAQSSWETTMRSTVVWWTGWKGSTSLNSYFGIASRYIDSSIWSTAII